MDEIEKNASDDSTSGFRTQSRYPLPHRKVGFETQTSLLKAYAVASTTARNPVALPQVADIQQVHQGTVSNCNPFFIDIGLIARSGRAFVPAQEVLDYKLRLDWQDPAAGHKLAPLIQKTWFAQAILPRLEMNPISEDTGIRVLSDASNASPDERRQLTLLIDYLELAGLLIRENGTLKGVRSAPPTSDSKAKTDEQQSNSSDRRKPDANSDAYTALTIQIPGCPDAYLQIPKGMAAEDWEFFTATLQSYLTRLKAKEGIAAVLNPVPAGHAVQAVKQ